MRMTADEAIAAIRSHSFLLGAAGEQRALEEESSATVAEAATRNAFAKASALDYFVESHTRRNCPPDWTCPIAEGKPTDADCVACWADWREELILRATAAVKGETDRE